MWGGFVAVPQMPWSDKGEFYFFGANENDGSGIQTRDRDVYTAGLRLYRQPRKGAFDYEWESMFQFGSVRATASPSDTVDLDHLAWFYHVAAGYSFMAPWSPRVYLEYDYASGDDDPNDDTNERFERFFGPNVLEFGPTSIHTAFVRANISSPGARIQVRPSRDVFAYLSYRAYWLASDKDGWRGASGLSDVSGNSDSFLGHLFFLRIKWKLHPNLKMEGGATYRIDGEFQDEAPGSPGGGNTIYSYFQASVMF